MRKGQSPRPAGPAVRKNGLPRHDAVILMAKPPLPGTVKTRLCPPLSPRDAATLYARMLADTAEEMARLRRVDRYLFLSYPAADRRFRPMAFPAFRLLPQRGVGLGERMTNAVRETIARGHRRVVVIGSDCPALSAARVRAAFRELRDGAFAVMGPSMDGGFYLIGLSSAAPELFRGVSWSGPRVLSRVVGNLRLAVRTFSLLPPETDVDTGADLAVLRDWTRAHARPSCPQTRAWLRRHGAARNPPQRPLHGDELDCAPDCETRR